MTISTTDTTLTLTGPEEPIASLTINGDVINFTAYDGTLESATAGTPYALSLNGFANQDDAFYDFPAPIDLDWNVPAKRALFTISTTPASFYINTQNPEL